MPEGMGADFLAIDEIQLCADPERGHVFTDRLLRARGLHETLFLGSDTMRGADRRAGAGRAVHAPRAVVRADLYRLEEDQPDAAAQRHRRLLGRERLCHRRTDLRRQKGGAAVVMGALSPRTRNAQVELYQNGDVDYLVATDAIGMGLNLDINHVAFSGCEVRRAADARSGAQRAGADRRAGRAGT
jgi:ATP-dependent RNA helicase SUPV3L1/SUV3